MLLFVGILWPFPVHVSISFYFSDVSNVFVSYFSRSIKLLQHVYMFNNCLLYLLFTVMYLLLPKVIRYLMLDSLNSHLVIYNNINSFQLFFLFTYLRTICCILEFVYKLIRVLCELFRSIKRQPP